MILTVKKNVSDKTSLAPFSIMASLKFKPPWLYERQTIDETKALILNFWVKSYSLYNTGGQKRLPLQFLLDLNPINLLSVHTSTDD